MLNKKFVYVLILFSKFKTNYKNIYGNKIKKQYWYQLPISKPILP